MEPIACSKNPGPEHLGYLFLAATREQWAVFENTSRLMAKMQLPVELLSPQEVAKHLGPYSFRMLKTMDIGPYNYLSIFTTSGSYF